MSVPTNSPSNLPLFPPESVGALTGEGGCINICSLSGTRGRGSHLSVGFDGPTGDNPLTWSLEDQRGSVCGVTMAAVAGTMTQQSSSSLLYCNEILILKS